MTVFRSILFLVLMLPSVSAWSFPEIPFCPFGGPPGWFNRMTGDNYYPARYPPVYPPYYSPSYNTAAPPAYLYGNAPAPGAYRGDAGENRNPGFSGGR